MKKNLLNKATMTIVGGTLLTLRNEIFALGDIDYVAYLILLKTATGNGNGTIRSLKHEIPVSDQNIESGIKSVLSRDLAYKERDENDRRGFSLQCTAQGYDFVHYIDPALTAALQYRWSLNEDVLLEFITVVEQFSKLSPDEFPHSKLDVSFRFAVGVSRLWREYIDFARTLDMTTAELHLLVYLFEEDTIDPADMKFQLHYLPSSLRATILRLSQKELLEVFSAKANTHRITLNARGRKTVAEAIDQAGSLSSSQRKETPDAPARGDLSTMLKQICFLAYTQGKPLRPATVSDSPFSRKKNTPEA